MRGDDGEDGHRPELLDVRAAGSAVLTAGGYRVGRHLTRGVNTRTIVGPGFHYIASGGSDTNSRVGGRALRRT